MLTRNFFLRTFGSNKFGFAEVFSRFLNWSTLPIVGLLIDPTLFGQVVLLSTAINILTTIGTFGQHRAVLQYGRDRAYESYGAVVVALLYALSVTFAGYLCFLVLQGDIPVVILIASTLTTMHALLSTQRRAFDSLKEFALMRISLTAFRALAVIGALVLCKDVEVYILAEICAVLVSFLLNANSVVRVFTERKDISLGRIARSGQLGLPILIQSTLLMAIMHFDKMLLAKFGEFSQLGQYGLLFMLSSSLVFVSAFVGIKYEVLIYQSDSQEAAHSVAQTYQNELMATQTMVAIILMIVWFAAKPLLVPDNSLPWFVLPLLLTGQIFGQSVLPWSAYLTRMTALSRQVVSVAIPASVSIMLNSYLIPEYGPVGGRNYILIVQCYLFMVHFIRRTLNPAHLGFFSLVFGT